MHRKNITKTSIREKVNTLRHVIPKAIGAKFQIKRYTVFEGALELFLITKNLETLNILVKIGFSWIIIKQQRYLI